MTAAITAGRPLSIQGLRRFDPARDLTPLADLIEVGFADNLDGSGRRMVAGLRRLGRWGWLGGMLSRWLLPPAANPQGYVWEEDGEVVGNASLLPVTGFPKRWVMANVVVMPQARRQGIGKSLVTHSIEFARINGAKEIILQVDRENEGATALYRSLGFSASEPRTTWIGRVSQLQRTPGVLGQVRRRKKSEWPKQWHLARTLHPEGLIWPYPPSPAYFRPQAWQARMGMQPDRHWVMFDGDHLLGSASLKWGYEPGTLRLILLVQKENRGQIEHELIQAALEKVTPFGEIIQMEYPSGVAESSMRALGFKEHRTLIWMNLNL